MYDGSTSTVERALQLAREGACKSIEDIRDALRAEQYPAVDDHTHGNSIKSQLNSALQSR